MIWAIKDNQKVKASPKSNAYCPCCNNKVISKCGSVKIWHWSHESLKECDSWYEPESEWHINWKTNFDEEEQEVKIDSHRADIKCKNGLVIELQNSFISADDICDRENFYGNMIWILNGKTLGKGLELRNKKSYLSFVWKNFPQSWLFSERSIYIDLTKSYEEIKEEMDDLMERINLIFNKLKILIGKSPREFDFKSYEYTYIIDEKEIAKQKEILETYNIWHDLSLQHSSKQDEYNIFNGKTIFLIKKLYENNPCTGWGYLISKFDFLKEVRI